VHRALRLRAAQRGHSTEAEVREILKSAVAPGGRLNQSVEAVKLRRVRLGWLNYLLNCRSGASVQRCRPMRYSRLIVAVLACSALLYAQGSGVHVHLAAEHPHEASHEIADVHEHGAAHVVNEHDADHSAAHADEGTVDLDLTGQALAKTSSLYTLVALFAAFALLVVPHLPLLVPSPRNRGLAYRQRVPHLLPPPQAPPFAS
jgi:plasmid stability protein